MTRGRSKSIVQKIANDVPKLNNSENALDYLLKENGGENNLTHTSTTYKMSRSKSLSQEGRNNNMELEKVHYADSITYPFTKSEFQKAESDNINSYDYDTILKPRDISHITDLQLDNILNFKNMVQRNKVEIEVFVSETNDVLSSVETLLSKYNRISNETLDFDKRANELLELQKLNQTKYDEINSYLQHFEQLDFITKNLSRSGSHLLSLKREFFINVILRKLDTALDFIAQHPLFKESEVYGSRFRQCMTRALTLIKNYLNNELKSVADSINKKLHQNMLDSQSVSLTIDLLIYNEYNSYLKYNQSNFNELICEMQKRAQNHSEYNGLIEEVLNKYFEDRLVLLREYIDKTSSVNSVFTGSNLDLVQTCQDQIYYFEKLIEREYSLFNKFFVPGQSAEYIERAFYEFLKKVLEPLYDAERLLVLKELNIGSLCQLTTLLQKYYEFDDGNYRSDVYLEDANSSVAANGKSIKYGVLFQPLLDETQERLIFRVQNYVDNKLMHFKPSALDLKIGNTLKRSSGAEDKINPLDVDYAENLFPDLYLPLGKSLTLLSNIYELINSMVFDDLAHYIVHACIELLKGGFLPLAIGHMGPIDGQLVYLNNLVILRNQINNFDIQYTRTDYTIDFTSGLSDIWQLIKDRKFGFNNGGILDLASRAAPKIINNMIDANYEIEFELRNAVTQFIDECSRTICYPLLVHDSESGNLVAVTSAFKDNLISNIPVYYGRIKLVIKDPVVTQFLMSNLSSLLVATYEDYYNKIDEKLETMDVLLKDQLNDIMDVDTTYAFITDMITQLGDDSESKSKANTPEFNEEILSSLQLDEPISTSKPASPKTELADPQ